MTIGIRLTSLHPLFKILRKTRPFSNLAEEHFSTLLSCALLEYVPKGKILIKEGAKDNDFMILLEGELEVRRCVQGKEQHEELEVGRIYPSETVGEIALLFGVPRQASVIASKESTVLRINGEEMEEMLSWSQCFKRDLQNTAETHTRMNMVRQATPFRLLPLDHVRRAFECMQAVEMEAGTVVVREGDKGEHYYVIESGSAEVWRSDPLTGEVLHVASLTSGDGFGEEALIVDGFRNATVKLNERSKVLVLNKNDFDQLMRPALLNELQAESARELILKTAAEWLDCRYDVEFDEVRIPGAKNLPLDKLRELSATLDKQKKYIVYCRSGRRSTAAAYLLRERGFDAYSLTGGVREWPYSLEGDVASIHMLDSCR